MNLARVIGTIVCTRKDDLLVGTKLLIVQPLTMERKPFGDPIVAADTVGAGEGEVVFYVTAREATIPFRRPLMPVDAAIVGIVDRIDLSGESEWLKSRDS
jgi:ethanolamine utilization protein EutN